MANLSNEYIRGLITGEGTFTFCTGGGRKIPAFELKMHIRDKEPIEMTRDALGIKNKVYEYNHQKKDGSILYKMFGDLQNIYAYDQ